MTELPTRSTETLHERLLRSGEALLDLVSVLPADLTEFIQFTAEGWSSRQYDVSLQLSTTEAERCMATIGGEWEHTTVTTATDVHHSWIGQLHGATVRFVSVVRVGEVEGGEPRG